MTARSDVTKKYKRLPPPQAVPFAGFKFARIPSREPVEKLLRQYLKRAREARSLTVALLKAEWGEGKTDAFNRYIMPEVEEKGDITYLVSTSTIFNKLSKASTLFPTNPPESVTLLATIFYSIRDELKAGDKDYSLFPEEAEFEDPIAYIRKALQVNLGSKSKNKKRMFVFIDEFEEILTHPVDLQKKFLSGLKELINGQLKIIHEGGEYQGCLHFIIACTPYAYNKLREDVDLKEIFGSISSRIGPSTIELPQIPRKEALQFLVDILNYCYEGEIPSPFPIRSSGILNGICTISQRNLRPIIQLMVELLNAASVDDSLVVIDYETFLSTFKGREISVYGETTPCIDNDLWINAEKALINVKDYGEKCIKLFKLLSGELKPFSVIEISDRIGIESEQVHSLVEIINQELAKIGISRAISRFDPLKEEKEPSEVINSLKPVDGQIMLIRNKIPLSKFVDEWIYYEVAKDGNLISTMLLPRENTELMRLFEEYEGIEIDEDEAEFLRTRLRDFFESSAKNRRFMLSKELSLQLYPSPVVMQIDFIMERPKRMGLWRETIKNFADMGPALRDGFIEVINNSGRFKISGVPELFSMKYLPQLGIEKEIATAIYATTTGVNMNDITKIKDLLKRNKIDLLLLVYVGAVDDDASKEIDAIPTIIPLHVKTIRAQQLIALSLARRRDIKINEKLLESKLRQIIYEFDFTRLFDSWLEKCKNEGIVVDDLTKTFGEKDESLAQAMVYYIETINKEFTLNEVFNEMKKLKSFTVYGPKKSSVDPLDIETLDKLKDYHNDLLRNLFIKETGTGKICVTFNPVEKRILEIIEKGAKTVEETYKKFVLFADNQEIFEQVYFPILESKGLIEINKDEISPVNKQKLEQLVIRGFEEYLKKTEERRNKPWWLFSHICISKERESKAIILNEFDEYVRHLRSKYDDPEIRYDKELGTRLLHLLNILLSYFNDVLEPTITEAYNQGRQLLSKITESMRETESLLSRLLEEYNKYSDKKYHQSDMEEYPTLMNYPMEIEEKMKKPYTREEIENGLELIDSTFALRAKYEGYPRYFYYKRPKEEASYFNYKVYELERLIDAFKTKNEEIQNRCKEVLSEIEDSSNLSNRIKTKLIQYDISEAYKVSKTIHTSLIKCQMKPIKAKPLVSLSIRDIKTLFDEIYNALKEFDGKVESSLAYLRMIMSREKTFISMKDVVLKKANNIKNFFEGYDQEVQTVSAISVEINASLKEYEKLIKDALQVCDASLSLDEINKAAEDTASKLDAITNSLGRADTKLQELCKRNIENLNSYKRNAERFLEVLKEAKIDVTVFRSAFEATISEANDNLTKLSLGSDVKLTWTDVWDDLEKLKKKLFDRVKQILSEDEFNVLFLVVEAAPSRKWFDSSELVETVVSNFQKTHKQAQDLIESLVDKKLLKKGISLPI